MRRILLFLACIMLTSTLAYGQGYIFSYVPDGGNPGGINTDADNVTTGWTDIITGSQSSNLWSSTVQIPFPFDFYGQPVTHLKASANGLVTFDTTVTVLPNVNEPLPSVNLPGNTIAALWDDFPTGGTGFNDEVQFKVFGTPGNRQLWIRWFSMTVGNPAAGFFYFGCVLEEGSNDIYVVNMWTNNVSSQATVGVQSNVSQFTQAGASIVAEDNTLTTDADNDYWVFTQPVTGVDLEVTGVLFSDLASNSCGTTNEQVSIVVQNNGTASVTNPPVSYSVNGGTPVNEVLTGTLTTGQVDTFTFATTANFLAVGTYTVNGSVAAPGDVDPANDAATGVAETTAPVALPVGPVDFTGYSFFNPLPAITNNLWYEGSGFPSPDSADDSWTNRNWLNTAGTSNGTAAAINLFATNIDGWIIGPKFTAQSNTVLSFDLALVEFFSTTPATLGSDDIFQVMISTDCGATFSPLNTYNSSTPISGTGQLETYSLAAFAGVDIVVAFYATSGTVNDPVDNDLMIDNILIYNQPDYDLGVTNILLPTGSICATPQAQAVVEVTNLGTNPVDPSSDPFDITVDIDGTLYNFTYSSGATLPPGATVTFPVSNNVDLSTPGNFTVKAWPTLTGPNPDGLAANDTAFEPIEILPTLTLPVTQDFETNFSPTFTFDLGWSSSTSSTPRWQVEDGPTGSGSTGPSGDNTTGSGQYVYLETSGGSLGDQSVFRSPCIDLSTTAPNIVMEYWYHMYGATIGRLDVQVWTEFGDTITVDSIIGQQQTASADPWTKRTVNLGAFANTTVKLAFVGTRGGSFTGDLAIDDIFIFPAQPFDIAAIDLDLPPDNGCLTSTELVTAQAVHNGTTPVDLSVDTLFFNLDVAGFPLQTQEFTTAPGGGTILNPGDTVAFTFTADYSQGGLIPTTFYTELATDGLSVNDTIAEVVASGSFAAPYFEPVENATGFEISTSFAQDDIFGPGWNQVNTGTFQWELETDATGSTNTGPGQDNTTGVPGQGIYMYTEASSGTQGDSARLISPCIDLGTLSSPRLEFYYHMFGGDMGDFLVEIEDGAGALTQVFFQSGQVDTAEADVDPWNRVVVDLTPYVGQTINIHFTGIRGSSFGGDMALDDILIYEPTGIDVGVVAIDGPAPACLLTPQTIDVSVVNFEQVTLDLSVNPITVTLETTPATPGAPFTATVPGDSIQAGDTVTFTITTAADFSAGGFFNLEAYTTVTGDAIPFNDGAEFLVTSLPLYATPYLENFETFVPDGNFSGNGTGLDFSWINDPTGPASAYNWSVGNDNTGSGSTGPDVDHTLGTPAGIYMYTEGSFGSTGDTAKLLSSCIDMTTGTDNVLEFWYHMHGSGMGTLSVNVVEDDGTRTMVWTISGEQQGDETEPWKFAFANLAAWANDTIQIEFVGVRGSSLSTDMAIDDVYVGPPSQVDVAALQVVSPASPGCLDSMMMVQVQVLSQGAAIDFATTNLTVSAELTGVTGPATFDTTLTTGILGVGDTLDLMLSGLANLGAAGAYQIELSALLAGGDSLPANDVITVAYLNVDTVSTPIGPVTFAGYNGSNLSTAFPGWDEGEGIGTPEIGQNSSWLRDDFANNTTSPNDDAARINMGFGTDDAWIVSPPFVPGNLDVMSFDLALTAGFSTNPGTLGPDDRMMVMVTTDCGASWTMLREYNTNSTISNTGQLEFVQLSQFNGQEIRIAFYAQEGPTATTTGSVDLFIDNILIEPGNQFDAALLGQLSPTDGDCGDTTMFGELEIINLGVDTLINLPLEITVTEIGGGSVVLNDTFPGPLALGEAGVHTFGPFDTYFGGDYEIKAIANLAGDQVVTNDTLVDTLTFGNSSPPNVAGVVDFCPGDSLLLVATDTGLIGGEIHAWFDSTGGPAIAVGDTFQTPAINAPTTYYVKRVTSTISMGPEDNTIGPGGIFAPASLGVQGLHVHVDQPAQVASVAVYPDGVGDVYFQVLDSASGTLVALYGPYAVTSPNVKNVIPLGITLPPGSYEINAEGGTVGLFRNTSGANYPYSIPGLISIVGNTFSPDYYYFFYDWKIQAATTPIWEDSLTRCDNPATQVDLIPSVAEAGFAVDSIGDLYLALTDTSANTDSVRYFFGDGGTTNDPNPVYNYADTGTYVVQQIAYSFCGIDTFETDVTITCVPAEGGFVVDSTGDLFASFSSTAPKADSVRYFFGDGNSSNDPNAIHTYADTGTYTVEQVAYHFCGNDTVTQEVTITCTFAVADFNIEIVPDSNGVTVRFISQAQNADSIQFDFGNGVTTSAADTTIDFQFTGTYNICMKAYNLCGEVETCQEVFLQNTGLNLIDGASISLYPNPTEGEFELTMDVRKASNLNIEVVDMRGRSIHQQSFDAGVGMFKHRFDLHNRLSEGVYLIKIMAGDQLIMRKLQVE